MPDPVADLEGAGSGGVGGVGNGGSGSGSGNGGSGSGNGGSGSGNGGSGSVGGVGGVGGVSGVGAGFGALVGVGAVPVAVLPTPTPTPDRSAPDAGLPAAVVPDDERLLIALDIDGTLLTYAGELLPGVAQAVADVRAAGHHVVLSTGRSVHATVPVALQLGILDGWAVSSNGSVTVRIDPALPDGYEVSEVITFDPGPALRLMHAQLPEAYFAVEEVGTGFRMNKPFPEGELTGEHQVVDLDDLAGSHVTRLIVRSPGHTSAEFHRLVADSGLADVTYSVGWTAWMDVAPAGVTKASALERLRGILGVGVSRTVAVGDGSNDVEMLSWATRGVAMGHAADHVQAAAGEVTGTVDEAGTIAVLRSLLL